MRLQRDKSQLLIVDVQEKLLPAIDGRDEVLAMCQRLVHMAKTLDVPITVSEQYPRGLGPTVAPLKDKIGNGARYMSKVHFSCLGDEALRDHLHALRKQGLNQVVIGGMEAHVCVAQTAIDLEDQGFEVFLVADAVSSRSPRSRELAFARLASDGVDVVDSEMVMFEWLDRAGTPEFKALQDELLK